MLDKTFLNLTTILITGSGLFAVLTKFNVPELGMTYFNQNPFAVKKDAIDSVMTWLFTSFALFGLVIQVFKEIFGAEIPDRLYKPKIYVLFILVGLFAMVWTVWLLSSYGKWIAKRHWLPEMVKIHRDMFESSVFIVEHDGWREEQLATKETVSDRDRYLKANYETAEQGLLQIENILELPLAQGTLKERIENLRPFFKKDSS